MRKLTNLRARLWLITVLLAMSPPLSAHADTAAQIDRNVSRALLNLYAENAGAKALGARAKGVLVFPDVVKAGLILGVQYGEGALRIKKNSVGYFSTAALSYGLQAGAQKFGYALFLMTDEAMNYVEQSGGWEIGDAGTIVVLNQGKSGARTTTTLKEGIYAFFFGERGFMAGIGLQGSKISRIKPEG